MFVNMSIQIYLIKGGDEVSTLLGNPKQGWAGGASHTGNQYTRKQEMEGTTEMEELPKQSRMEAANQAAELG